MNKILVCGGRDFNDWMLLAQTLNRICYEREWNYDPFQNEYTNCCPNVTIIHGGARGVDLLADKWAILHECVIEEYKADWDKYGKSAGPIRNQLMLDVGKPDLVIAFPTKNSKGTWDMVSRAKKKGIETIIVS